MHRDGIEENEIYEVHYRVRMNEIVHSGLPGHLMERTLSKLENRGIEYDVRKIGELK